MADSVQPQTSIIGDTVYLQDNGSGSPTLPAVDATQLTALPLNVPGAIRITQTTVDFGFPTGPIEGDTASVTVSATWVSANTKFVCTAVGGTADHDLEDAVAEGILGYVTNVVASTSFDVVAYAPEGTWGRYFINVVTQQ